MTNSILFLLALVFSSHSIAFSDLKDRLFEEARSGQKTFTYADARKKMFNEVYLQNDSKGYFVEDVYCQAKHYPFNGQHPNGRLPDHEVFNTEHTWPQSKFSPKFRSAVQKTDLHHLYPTLNRINSERGNNPFAEVNPIRSLSCAESQFGTATTTGEGSYFEPPHAHKGNVARAMFYFSIRYQISIDPVQEHYFRLWHKEDPVTEADRIYHERIAKLQGNRNPFIDSPELVDQIEDF